MNPQPTNSNSYHLQIGGMTCAACASRIEKVLNKTPHTDSARVNYATKSGFIQTSSTLAEVISRVEKLGYTAKLRASPEETEKEAKLETELSKRRAYLALGIALITVVFAMILNDFKWSGMVQFILATWMISGPGRGFTVRAIRLARNKDANMDTLIALGSWSAYLLSLWLLIKGAHHLYFESLAMIQAFVLLGKYVEERSRYSLSSAITELVKLSPKSVIRISNEGTEDVIPTESLVRGDTARIRPGERFPADGLIKSGISSMDLSLMTGESEPLPLAAGDSVTAGALNLTGVVDMEVTSSGRDNALTELSNLILTAEEGKPEVQKTADKIASVFVPMMLAISLLTFLGWTLSGAPFEVGLVHAVTVLVVACPCALGLATPLALLASVTSAARLGILVRKAEALEILNRANCIVFDKTGTLTLGYPKVTSFTVINESYPKDTVLGLSHAIEKNSLHPYGKAIAKYAFAALRDDTSKNLIVSNIREIPGSGIEGQFDGKKVSLLKAEHAISGQTTITLTLNSLTLAHFTLEDDLRPDAKEAILELKSMKITPIIASGDLEGTVKNIATKLQVIDFYAEQSPEDKLKLIETLKKSGKIVAMAGDGINDAPSLASAHIGLAMGGGTDTAHAASALSLNQGTVRDVVKAIKISKMTFKTIKQNLFWAFSYNVILIPLAAFGKLTPMVAGAAMTISSLIVVLNSVKLSRTLPKLGARI